MEWEFHILEVVMEHQTMEVELFAKDVIVAKVDLSAQ